MPAKATDPISIPVTLHPKQAEVFEVLRDRGVRETTLRKGRRAGGTFVAALAATDFAISYPKSPVLLNKPTEIGFYGPIYLNARRLWQEIVDSFGAALASYRESDLSLIWHGGARGTCYSGEKLGGVLGSGQDIAVVDEASNFPAQLIRSYIVPALADRQGRLWQVSSPRHGKLNHFALRAVAAEAGTLPGIRGFHMSSYDNPNLSREWLDAQKNDPDMDERTFQEEYLAMILDSSSSWLDPSEIQRIASDKIPGNTFNVLTSDFAWAAPEAGMIDLTSRTRKDANVLAVLSQDTLGNVYLRKDGLYEKYIEPDEAFDAVSRLIRKYDVKKFVVEREVNVNRKTDDMFGRLWRNYMDKHNVQVVGMVRPQRGAKWKTPAIRRWSVLLSRGKFFIEEGSVLDAPLCDEMMKYSETAASNDRCHDDVLVTQADIMLPGVFQGRFDTDPAMAGGPSIDVFHLQEQWAWSKSGGEKSNYVPVSKHSIV